MYPNFSEFGLYRYNNNGKPRTKNGIFSSMIVYSILAMSIIFGGLLYVFMSGRFSEITSSRISNSTRKQVSTKNVTDTNVGLEVIEITGKNFSESHAKRIKRLDSEDESNSSYDTSPESQRLIFYPSRTLKPPRIVHRPKVVHYPSLPPNHKISSRRIDPRVYQAQPRPHEFLKPPTARAFYGNQLNNIQDVISSNHQFLQHNYHPSQLLTSAADGVQMMGANPIQLGGNYRHPRTNGNLAHIFQQSKPQTLKAEASDPFRNFKPASPAEVNQMLNQHINDDHLKYMGMIPSDAPFFRRKFRQKSASAHNYNNHVNDAANIYDNGVQTGKKRVQNRNEIQQQGKPFSVMLDVFPLPGEENDMASPFYHMPNIPNMKRIKPILNRYYQDPTMFNGMNFPQVRYPAYFRYQNPKQQQQFLQQQASSQYGTVQNNGMMKPSQLVVHLNLFPKGGGTANFKRTSSEDQNFPKQNNRGFNKPMKVNFGRNRNQSIDVVSTPFNINFNVHTGNGHPENTAHQKQLEFNRTSTEATISQNYNYDDEEEEEESNVSDRDFSHIRPSLIYKDVYRDKPIHLMLKNATASTTRKPRLNKYDNKYEKFEKTKNLKFHYQTIDRPKPKYSSVVKQKSYGPFF